ncbi:MAG: efflux RND transporter periplasmic adaptor subunit [Desulfobacula sp.]|nr:efflux RND transporter periplasmic adaptor subunit [Desulfobacula sp.]
MPHRIFNSKGVSGFRTVLIIFSITLVLGLVLFFLKDRWSPGERGETAHGDHAAVQTDAPKSDLEQEAEDFFDETPGENKTSAAKTERKIIFYRNPMDPAISSPVPAKDEMGMDYIPVYEDEAQGGSGAGITGMAPVIMDQQGIELSGVITAPAVSTGFVKTIRTVGQVLVDETRVHRVQTRVSGWVEELFVNYKGRMVTKGTPLLSIYSPELVSGQEEFLGALEAREKNIGSKPSEERYLKTILDAAGKRLRLFDVPDAFIKELEQTKKVRRLITLEAPVSGFVTGKEVFSGQRVEPGMELLTITDLSRVWVEADFYEYEAGELKTGQTAELFSSYDPGLLLKGQVTYIYPYLNTESRSLRARIEFSNEDLRLKPGMFVDVRLNLDLGESVVIPDSAVMYSGVRKIVFVNTEGGRFEPREVRVGAGSDGQVQVLSGVSAGEHVAIKANFLLDSESRLQAIIQGAVKKAKPDGDKK